MHSPQQNSVISADSIMPASDLTMNPPVFEGVAKAIALFLEGPISDVLAVHAGHARLEAFVNGIAYVRLGGGCQGCPSSQITLFNVVRTNLQDRFGDHIVLDVIQA